jgi:hypothetical protein
MGKRFFATPISDLRGNAEVLRFALRTQFTKDCSGYRSGTKEGSRAILKKERKGDAPFSLFLQV